MTTLFRYPLTIMSCLICVAGAAACAIIFGCVVWLGQRSSIEAMFVRSWWTSIPYVIMAAIAICQNRYAVASFFTLVCIGLITSGGVWLLYDTQLPLMTPPDGRRVLVCFPVPPPELLIPVGQIFAFGFTQLVAVGLAWLQRASNRSL